MKQHIHITDAELEVMRVLWAKPDCPSSEVVKQLEERMEWSPNTSRTLLTRLVQKEAAGARLEDGSKRNQLFYPVISEQEYLRSETTSFMKKLYGGALKPMLAHFLVDKKLNKKEIEDLKSLFDENHSDE
ncbi:BlaI/MecI/CopY family transcriptional regulator [Paenibacillus sp. 481]|uniref:BlaI/MecI/CopY family transcriptional regulator n=1 Tax=Paenibacillus sp. 481 TaxID=2835869 RepID=UPI001E5C0625|nr:BlaI/MecI/CopY family transcriptional regulator [Paenibacillus sp. 481]UHA73341.1 BlaI/MecI/CopY family transcriptional regulator [Paenibacillus sp. 481]